MRDIFISHAGEDKDDVARPLAQMLSQLGISVWFDEFELCLGDSLRGRIDEGLAISRHGLVILSPSFFSKKWPQAELNGLFAMEMSGGKSILPVWHQITKEGILQYSPLMADKVAARTSEGLSEVVKKIVDAISPEGYSGARERTVRICPVCIDLSRGDWSVNNIVTVSNLTDRPVYWVKVKLTFAPSTIDLGSVHVKIDGRNKLLDESVGVSSISVDAFMLEIIDSQGRKSLVVMFHHLDPHSSRHMRVSGTASARGQATIQLWDFDLEPSEVRKKDNSVAIPMKFTEDLKLIGTRCFVIATEET